jgi:hypothetical protein
MPGGPDAFPIPNAIPERLIVAAPVDRAKRDNAEPEPQPEQRADADPTAGCVPRRDFIELA